MSYSFRINVTTLPSLRSLFENAGVTDVVCRQEIDLDQDWPEGVLHFYRPNISCRVIEVTFENGLFDVRIMANSSEDDYQLGLKLIEAAACQGQTPITSEEGDVVSPNEFASRFGSDWVTEMIASTMQSVVALIERQGQTVQLNGAIRPFVVGPEMLTLFRAWDAQTNSSEAQFLQRFFEAFRNQQWADLDQHFSASVMKLSFKESGNTCTASSFGVPGLSYLLQKVDYLIVTVDDDQLFLTWEHLSAAVGDDFHRLDENLCVVDAISASEWLDVGRRIRSLAVVPK